MASRKRERVVTDMAEAIAIGLAVFPADMGAGSATGGVSVRAAVGPAHRVVPAARSDSGGPWADDDPPLNPALANDPGGWCVYAPDWVGGRPVIARDAAGGALCGLTETEARLVVRVLGSDYTAAREV